MKFVEQAIFGRVIDTLLLEGFRVEISDFDGGGRYLYAYANNAKVKNIADVWAKFQPANDGVDFIIDYSANLEEVLKPIFTWIEALVGE